ncbi:MAG TPA: Trk system potassium transporter TrkA [Eubacteriales bacterium]|nr:Trk system potassium transporter TrkA [Clostridia bacterium]HRV73578.1 Trk system potassium transporter TrkA [Eubacteriales bacterium]
MKIVIAGNGKVGYALAEQLSREEHDVTVIDNNEDVLERSEELLDVMTVYGNGASLETQTLANVSEADLLIAATSADEINILSCLLARKLGCKQTIARVRNPEYGAQLQFLKDDLGLSMTFSPDRSAAHAIFRVLQFPSFLKLDSFARSRIELVELSITPGSALDGIVLDHLYEIAKVKLLVCCVDRAGIISIPRGGFVLKSGDKISVTAATRDLAKMIRNLDISSLKIKNVMICGSSPVTEYLAEELIESRVNVKIVAHNLERCKQISENIPQAIVICGDYKDEKLMLTEGISKVDAYVALTDYDEDNIVLSLYAGRMGAKKSVACVDRSELIPILQGWNTSSIVSPKHITVNEVLRFVRALDKSAGGSMITMHSIMDGKAEALEFEASEGTKHMDVPLAKLRLKPNILISCITHGGDVIIPKESDCIRKGDSVVVVTKADSVLSELNDIFLAE